MTSRDDAVRATVAPMLDDLRGELLVMPRAETVERHLNMMTFEQQVLATPRFVEKKARKSPMPTPRRAAIAFICVVSTLASCGLSAAGALPGPLQNITDSIAHTLGVPKSTNTKGAPSGHSAGAPTPTKPAPDASPKISAKAPEAAPDSTAPAVTRAPTTSTTEPLKLPGANTPIAKTPAHPPAQPITPVGADPQPTKNSSNTPPGYPTDWRYQATEAAALRLQQCAKTTSASQIGCPQSAIPVGPNTQIASISWTLLNVPEDGAAVIAKTQPGNPRIHLAPTTTVTVYEAFQMSATYTEVGATDPHLAYSGGIGVATMKWNGSSFDSVSFSPGSVAGKLPVGVIAPTIPQLPNVDNGMIVEALQAGFAACTTAPAPVGDPVAGCPQPTTVGANWTLVGDPTASAVVSYDSQSGLYTVTGSYAMTSDQGATASGPYTATLFFDNFRVWVLGINGA
jgi:hypothetical protein